ncbi:hypothetical protein AB5I41_06175 [Sphingomonas sp. MMS24-JH45]
MPITGCATTRGRTPTCWRYLKAENAYADQVLKPLQSLEKTLYQETLSRKQDDTSVPYRDNGYWYQTKFATGADYPTVVRRRGTQAAREEMVFDQPAMAKGHNFFQIGDWSVSPDNRLVAWTEDLVGRRQFVLKVKDLAMPRRRRRGDERRGRHRVVGRRQDPVLRRKGPGHPAVEAGEAHVLATPASADRVVYEEPDDSFYISVGQTSDRRYVCIVSQSTVSDVAAFGAAPRACRALHRRRAAVREFRYGADHMGNRWIVRTNRGGAKNYKLVTVADAQAARGPAAWRDMVPASATTFIEGFKPFAGLHRDRAAQRRQQAAAHPDRQGQVGAGDGEEPAFAMELGTNEEAATPWVRYTYTSLVTPTTTFEVNALTGQHRTLKVAPVPWAIPRRVT